MQTATPSELSASDSSSTKMAIQMRDIQMTRDLLLPVPLSTISLLKVTLSHCD
jgi:hypothetical protein